MPASADAVIFVDTFADENAAATDNGACSLREAIEATNTDATVDTCVDGSTTGTDTIELPQGTYTLTGAADEDANASGDLDFTDTGDTVVVTSAGNPQNTFIQTGSSGATPGTTPPGVANGTDRVVHTLAGTNVVFERVTIRNGHDASGFGGGGMRVQGTVTLDHSAVIGNSSTVNGGGIVAPSNGVVILLQSEVSGNVSQGGAGGGIVTSGSGFLRGNSSTITGNAASFGGGGLLVNGGTATLAGMTIAGNRADADGTGGGSGGGLSHGTGPIHVVGTVIADNTVGASGSSPDCNGFFISYGFNVIEDASGCTASFQTSDETGVDPQLGPLDVGPLALTRSHLPAPDSVVVDLWPTSSCTSTSEPTVPGNTWPPGTWTPQSTDQRDVSRPQGPGCDSGAVELRLLTLTVTLEGAGSGTVASSPAGISCPTDCSESTYVEGTTVTVAATATSGTLAGWSGTSCTGTGPCIVTMDSDHAVIATFDSPAAKGVTLTARPKKVEKNKKVTLTAVVTPCAGHEGDLIQLFRKARMIGEKTSDSSCTAVFKVKMKKPAKFRAISPVQDVDHLAGTSNVVKVKVKPPSQAGGSSGGGGAVGVS